MSKLSLQYQRSLFDKIEASGLFDLAANVDAIKAYGRSRLATLDRIKGSAGAPEVLDGVRDTVWLSKLTEVLQKLSRDPVTLATVYKYFPELVNFFFAAIAATADYSNEGKGGGKEDPLNDPQAVLDDLMSALGQEKGQNIFTGAWDLINTGQRIEKAIAEFPFRQNIPPSSPDIFHLRLGAANFYVPPIAIDVQTQFKASSLGSGALRQKNSPKFNSGYKHTNINLQLFFPNYEEIWGISIEDASKITLKDNFTIDFSGNGDNDEKIDKFLSSLRGLVAAFKYAPFLPVRNHYLNSVYGITAIALNGMSISTIPNYPFALVVTLNLYNFNHKPFLPMINDFNQAIHWGKFRQYMGKAAGALHNYINEEFLMFGKEEEGTDQVMKIMLDSDKDGNITSDDLRGLQASADRLSAQANLSPSKISSSSLLGYKNEVFTSNVIREWINGSNLSFYMPAETQTKIFTPDISGFRSQEEKTIDDIGRGFWNNTLKNFGIDINESSGYHRSLDSVITTSVGNIVEFTVSQKILQSIDILTAGRNTTDFQKKAYEFIITSFIFQNPNLTSERKNYLKDFDKTDNSFEDVERYIFGSLVFEEQTLSQIKSFLKSKALNTTAYLDFLVDEYLQKRVINAGKTDQTKENQEWKEKERKIIKDQFAVGYSSLVYERFFKAGPIRELMEAARERSGSFHIREWEVPMIRVDIDPTQAIVTDVSISMSNNIIPLQVQLQEEPTYQHIGGGDSYINISMKVFGEKELIKLRKIFDHINGLARLEHAAGVMGFLGIKNIITALSGVKYVLPLSFNVSTIPNFPHVYDVSLRLVDFDIFQQKREQLSSDQQRKMIEEFGTKKNPFLRMKQLWGSFNTYPDFPLEIRNKDSEVVGCLDPDFYFRSFEMFDRDVIHSVTENKGKLARLNIFDVDSTKDITVVTPYGAMPYRGAAVLEKFKEYILNDKLDELRAYAKGTLGLKASQTASYILEVLKDVDQPSDKFLLDYVDSLDEEEFDSKDLADSNWRISSGRLRAGDLSSFDENARAKLQAALKGNQEDDNFKEDDYISFNPDEIDSHAIINTFPAASGPYDNKIPSMIHTADGYQFGYVDKTNGRFYLTVDDIAIKKDSSIEYIGVTDTQTPDVGTTKSLTGVPGAKALSEYQYSYSSGDEGIPETMKSNGNSKSVSKHWEKMMIDTQYRDISGRMVRAFPTYMLWLIDEKNFAGTKLFDNFYGLQSIIDFSIVSSEDILGDTLVFRASNMYAKLSTKEATTIFSGRGETDEKPGVESVSLTSGLEQVIDRTLNFARNQLGHMESQYIVDIENIRLKPGVRVHLRAGYGANPNSLHTVFNGVITEVELGEIVTVTCQSDAIELSPVVNSVDKKGDSGHIDGGINTGLYLSEPRDLMVRLLSMGTSRTREAFAHATRGKVFSENKFGIRHFGTILYEPLTESERNKNIGVRNSVEDVLLAVGQGSGVTGGIGTAAGAINPFGDNSNGTGIGGSAFGLDVRIPMVGIMRTMWSNFASQPDLELFKRNIYPGNGTGVAQFLGGDLGDGWSNAASLTPEDMPNPRLEYLNRLTDSSWNDLLQRYDYGSETASAAIDKLSLGMESRASGEKAAGVLGVGLLAAGAALAVGTGGIALPAIGGAIAIGGVGSLAGSLTGRGGVNIWKTFGLISDMDDDMPGFDEVSFRAQTYMKSVWDLFQLCARLLPNYIVAVRPFEDRSTVFYGKPHWLYTSAVVPITTGFPSEKKAVELGLKTPSYRSPDSELMDLLVKVNKQSNPLSDYEAMKQGQNPAILLADVVKQQSSFSDVYAPAGILRGKVINFLDPNRRKYYANNKTEKTNQPKDTILSEIPKNKGYVTVGFHLPIDVKGENSSEIDIEEIKNLHKEIPQMPLRFSFPFFTDRVAGAVLIDYAFYALSNNRSGEGEDRAKTGTIHDGDKDLEKFNHDTLYRNLIDTEASLIANNRFTEGNPDGPAEDQFTINLSNISFTSLVNPINTFGNDQFIFDLSTSGAISGKRTVRMPLPSLRNQISGLNTIEGSWEYDYINQTKITASSPFSYRDWGSPTSALDEQFYIAMRWPYEIIEDKNNEIFKKFKDQYFSDRNEDEFYGTPKDYKNRKVLVYSPTTRTAVVCKPAYFLWGTDKADLITGTSEGGGGLNDWDDQWIVSPRAAFAREVDLAAVVSPDAAYYLGVMHLTENEKYYFKREVDDHGFDENRSSASASALAQAGLAPVPMPRDCYFTFVDDTIPLGVVTTVYNPANEFKYKGDIDDDKSYFIGFGKFSAEGEGKLLAEELTAQNAYFRPTGSPDSMERQLELLNERPTAFLDSQWQEFLPTGGITLLDSGHFAEAAARGGNIIGKSNQKNGYFDLVLESNYSALSRESLYQILDNELKTTGSDITGSGREQFAPVYDIASPESVKAREFFDEGFSASTHVIAGNGRTLSQANDIWDQFRFDYHNYSAVKKIFFDVFGLDPDDIEALPDFLIEILRKPNSNPEIFKKFEDSNNSAEDEFSLLLGSDFITNPNQTSGRPTGSADSMERQIEAGVAMNSSSDTVKQAIEFARKNLVDASLDDGGLINYFNVLTRTKYRKLGFFLQSQSNLNLILGADVDGGVRKVSDIITDNITPKQVFLLIVGMFRQAMWQDAYSRAWLVLKPNRKYTSDDMWDFSPVHKIFAAFIDPNQDYSSNKRKFLKLLADNKGEGNSAGNVVGVLASNIDSFWDSNIGPLFTALSDGLSGLMNMFRMSMLQMGYGLSNIDNFSKQANILNKVLNDSIYYSLGRTGSLLRAIDNPFTREYGEPVVEVREPFQKIHYISSFSTIIANNIQETVTNVATQVTAVSEGKYPVTVALDKSIPAERQTEKTVETGLYFDNIFGEGLFGIAQPLFHPIEFARGAIKLSQGAPDELMAKRVALAHLKESLKDIYSGELIVIGSPDIRPHDLVYLADVYERMYGMFEVEQVVHHFTPNMGFITSITPNALVTINDPARWFMSSWIHSWLSIQNMRNDTRSIINSVQAGNTGVLSGGNISLDAMSEALRTQMMGGVQFTHGSSALMSDIMANFAAEGLTDAQAQIELQMKQNSQGISLKGIAATYLITVGLTAGVGGLLGGPIGAGALGALGAASTWKGWKWVRDNVLDQHGCYISYLNKNGQPMDASLAINQGMVVGRYHTKRLLPGILGVRSKVRTFDGHAFIRNDDLLKSLGWKEKEITDLVRYVSYENSLVNSQVLRYSGTGPDKTGLNQYFKVICKLVNVIDGDEIEVIDLMDATAKPFKVRLEGIIASSLGTFQSYTNTSTQAGYKPDDPMVGININSPGAKSTIFINDKLRNKPFVLRISPNDQSSISIYTEDDLSPGSRINNTTSYFKGVYYGDQEREKSLGTVFYRMLDEDKESNILSVRSFFVQNVDLSVIQKKQLFKDRLYKDSVFYIKFDEIYNSIYTSNMENHFTITGDSDPLLTISNDQSKLYNDLVNFKILETLYSKASEWPYISWDDYYNDGAPATLNWELVINNLAQVYTLDLLRERSSTGGLDRSIPTPKYIPQSSGGT